jgi:hypothetical protein
MKIGDLDVTTAILNLEHDLNVLNQVLNHIYNNNPHLMSPSEDEILEFRKNAVKLLQEKYPNMGIEQNS